MRTAVPAHVDALARKVGSLLIKKASEVTSGPVGRKATALAAAYMLREALDALSPDERTAMHAAAIEILSEIETRAATEDGR